MSSLSKKKLSGKVVKVAVIGVGNIGKHHVRNIVGLPLVQLVAVVDVDKKARRQICQKYGCRSYASVADLLKHEKLDAVTIAAPTHYHFLIAKETLKRGIHTFVEKPISSSVAQAEALIDLARINHAILFIGHIERFNTAVVKVKKLLQQNEIGTVISLVARRVGLFPPRSPDTDVIVDLAVHDIDIFSFLLGEYPQRINASGGKIRLKKFIDHAELFLHYPGGTTGYIQVSWITPVKIRTLSITGTKGYLELDYIKQTIQVIHNNLSDSVFDNFGQFVLKSEPTKKFWLSEASEEPLKLELSSFLDCVSLGKPAAIPGEIGLQALKIALQAVKNIPKK